MAVVDRTANLEQAANEILASRTFFSGQSPYAPNCVLVNEFAEAGFVDALCKITSENDPHPAENGFVKTALPSGTNEKALKSSNNDSASAVFETDVARIAKVRGRYQHRSVTSLWTC